MPGDCDKVCDIRRGVCGIFVRAAKWIPVVFISAIVVWSYYAYVVHLCILTIESLWERILLIVLYHIFFIMFIWAYWQTVFTQPGSVPLRFSLTSEEMDAIENSDNAKVVLEQIVIGKDLPCSMRSIHQEVRYCTECSAVKPDRAHHCGVCGQCVLKMDHHCPWVNNCVAFMNYKFFILFLGYALCYCIFVALSSFKYFLDFWTTAESPNTGKFHVLFLFFVSSMFSISVASLFFYHLYLVSRNMSTLESFRAPTFRHGPDKLAFHLGTSNNFQEVFGDNHWTWLLPVFTSLGDGVTFPQRCHQDEETGLLGPSPPTTEFPSEEHVPMILHHQRETTMLRAVNANDSGRHFSSSSGSENDLRNGRVASNNGSVLTFPRDDEGSQQHLVST